jgi:thioredoxin reductase (NADPH)
MATHRTKVLIIGGGPAGYTAAIYAARASLEPFVVQGMTPGGQLTITKDVENYPGFADPVEGPHLMQQMQAQAERYGARLFNDIITDTDFSSRPFVCKADSGDVFMADTVIVATGAQARWLGVPGEALYQGAGVSACATCDGFFFRGRNVVVIGGGNTALEEALYLTHHAAQVTIIHRRDRFRGERILQERVMNHPKIKIVWNNAAEAILGEGGESALAPRRVTGLRLRDTLNGATSEWAADGVFVAIGHDPATSVFKGKLSMDEDGYILTAPDSCRTSVAGVFAAGDVKDKVFRQAVTAAGMGCMAALEAEKFLAAG